jgi:endo-1,4-beta-xylanase
MTADRSIAARPRFSRRAVLAGALALAGCNRGAARAQAALSAFAGARSSHVPELPRDGPVPNLRDLSDLHVGCCFNPDFTSDPAYGELIGRQFSQITPEWNFQMAAVLKEDGSYDWTTADQIVAFAQGHGQRVHAHSLVWYALDKVPNFQKLDGDAGAFADAYRRHIHTVAGHFAGVASSWDVVNEAVAEDGEGLRDCLWSRNLGVDDYILLAFQAAAEADPNAVLFLNDYNLEIIPKKRETFMRLVERLLHRGCPIAGIGTQTHLNLEARPGMTAEAIRDLASFGLKIHISEFDVAFGPASKTSLAYAQKEAIQADLAAETMDAFLQLPLAQRYAFTNWGARDRDSFLNRPSYGGDGTDVPDLFDNDARPKPAFWSLADRLAAQGKAQ